MIEQIVHYATAIGIDSLPAIATLFIGATLLWSIHKKGQQSVDNNRYQYQLLSFLIIVMMLVLTILSLPVKEALKGQLLTLLGLILTAVITLSSTTVAANAMAGLILRTLKKFRPGDFISVGEHFGRVTEQDLFHTEIQTEDRDLTTLPNTFLLSQPYKVVHSSGTIVSAEVSLGYDLDHQYIEKILIAAATDTQLNEPFVYVTELGDFSVVYRVCGFLEEVKKLISIRSSLRKNMLDQLHKHGVEIVSPSFMNQRRADDIKVIPMTQQRIYTANERPPEDTVFDKANKAENMEAMRDTYNELKEEIQTLENQISSIKEDTEEKTQLSLKIEKKTRRMGAIKRLISTIEGNNK